MADCAISGRAGSDIIGLVTRSPVTLPSELANIPQITFEVGLALRPDVVVIAGKGHETSQTIGSQVVPFDDRAVARELLEAAQ